MRFLHLLLLVWVATPSFGQVLLGKSLLQVQNEYGLMTMDDVVTPLLQAIRTNEPIDDKVHAYWSETIVEPSMGSVRFTVLDSDQFASHEAIPQWRQFINEKSDQLKQAAAYVVPTKYRFGSYDFQKKRFIIQDIDFSMKYKVSAFHCNGALRIDGRKNGQQYGGERITACLISNELYAKPYTHYFPMADQSFARQIDNEPRYNFNLYVVGVPSGPYEFSKKGKELIYYRTEARHSFEKFKIAGTQSIKVKALLLVARESNRIVAISRPGPGQDWVSSEDLGLNLRNRTATSDNPDGTNVRMPNGTHWRKSLVGSPHAHFIDEVATQRLGPTVLTSVLVNGPIEGLDGSKSSISVVSFNCARRTKKLLSLRVFSDLDGLGTVTAEPVVNGLERAVELSSLDDQDMNAACNVVTPVSVGSR